MQIHTQLEREAGEAREKLDTHFSSLDAITRVKLQAAIAKYEGACNAIDWFQYAAEQLEFLRTDAVAWREGYLGLMRKRDEVRSRALKGKWGKNLVGVFFGMALPNLTL